MKKLCLHFNELNTSQLYQVMSLRQEVFVVEQNCPYLDTDGKDQFSWHVMFLDENENLSAYCRLLPKGVSYEKYPSIGRILTAPAARKRGLGKQLMKFSIAKAEELFGRTAIKISAQCYLENFYKSFGFEPVGEMYLEDDIPHIAMVRNV